MQIDETVYDSSESLLEQLQKNKETNYIPGNIPIDENHQLISDTLKPLCDKLNALLQVLDKDARDWYEKEALSQTWSARTLQRNISSQYY